MKKICRLFALIILMSVNARAQPALTWAKQMGGTSDDEGTSVAVDASGNVYTTGFFNGVGDYNPGSGILSLSPVGGYDIYVSKLDASGNFVWAKQFGGTSDDYGYAVAFDASGNVYVTGAFSGTSDFDPGSGVFNLTSAGLTDIFVCKLNASGNFVWAKQLGGTSNDNGYSIKADASGNVYTTGSFSTTADFDPGSGVFNLTSAGLTDIFVSKLDASGNFVWAKRLGGGPNDQGNSLAVDASGNVFSTGFFSGTSDFDPGAGTFNLISFGMEDIYVSALDASGNFLWARQMGGTARDESQGIDIDAAGNVYTTGGFSSTTADFDPGGGTYTFTTSGGYDAFVSKLDNTGSFAWAGQFGGSSTEYGNSVSVDALGNVYTTGYFSATDFNPGPANFPLIANGIVDIYVSKLDAAGNFGWAVKMGGSQTDYGNSIAVDAAGSVHTTGFFMTTVDFDPGAGTLNFTVGGSADIFVQKLAGCTAAPLQPGSISGTVTSCAAGVNTYSIALVAGAYSYAWSLPGGWLGASTTNTISATSGVTGGTISVSAVSACGTSAAQTLSITVIPLPTLTVNSGSICSGSSFTMSPGGAITYTFSSGGAVVSPTTTSSYSVTGTSSAGCVSASAAVSAITVNPLPTITVNSGAICAGASFTMSPGGAITYTFSGGSAVVSPTANASYSVTGTDANGCISGSPAISSVTVNLLPSIGATTSNTLLCTGQTATITASGASTYTFNPGGTGTSIAVSPTITSTYTINGTDANGCSNMIAFTQSVSLCTGIVNSTTSGNPEIIIYPNPFNDKMTIVSSGEKQVIRIFNSLGELILSSGLTAPATELNVSQLAKGIYFVRVGAATTKIIKE